MRITKILTGSLIAGSALLVVACGSNEDAAVNNTVMNIEEPMLGNDMTGVDAMSNSTDANLGAMDSNATTVDTTVNTTDTTVTTETNTTTTNGM